MAYRLAWHALCARGRVGMMPAGAMEIEVFARNDLDVASPLGRIQEGSRRLIPSPAGA
jgi:hypothetical protein